MDVKNPEITQDVLKSMFDYDANTGMFTRKSGRTNAKSHSRAGSLGSDGYASIYICGRNIKSHRAAWMYVYGVWPERDLDHINGDRCDNRICNLREATRAENTQNIGRAYKNNKSSGVLGVYLHACGKWQAKIQVNKKSKSLGLFDSIEDASAAYKKAKSELHKFSSRVE